MLITKVEYFPESKVQEGVGGMSNKVLLASIDFSGRLTTKSGTIKTYKNGKLHSYHDEPAIIFNRGSLIWYNEGIKTRIGGPAEVYADGRVGWWLNDKLVSFGLYMKLMDEETKIKILLTYPFQQ